MTQTLRLCGCVSFVTTYVPPYSMPPSLSVRLSACSIQFSCLSLMCRLLLTVYHTASVYSSNKRNNQSELKEFFCCLLDVFVCLLRLPLFTQSSFSYLCASVHCLLSHPAHAFFLVCALVVDNVVLGSNSGLYRMPKG